MKQIPFLLFIAIIFYGCPTSYQNPNCERFWYYFSVPVTFSPSDSILHLGDTITITSRFSSKLWDKDSIDQFIFDSIDFHVLSGLSKIDTFNGTQVSQKFYNLCELKIDTVKYNYRQANISFSFDYFYTGDEYYVEFKMIPKYRGVYYFSFQTIMTYQWDYLKHQKIHSENSGCETEYWIIELMTNNGIGNNKEYLKLSPSSYYNTERWKYWNADNIVNGVHLFKVE